MRLAVKNKKIYSLQIVFNEIGGKIKKYTYSLQIVLNKICGSKLKVPDTHLGMGLFVLPRLLRPTLALLLHIYTLFFKTNMTCIFVVLFKVSQTFNS